MERKCIKELDIEDISRELKLLEPTLTIVLSKWAPRILYLLYLKERMSFNDIKRALNVRSRVLLDKLKTLEKEGIIERTVTDGNPPRVHYALTEIGRTFALALVPFLTIVKAKQKVQGFQ